MKPTHIVLTDKGIACIVAPEKPEPSYLHITSSLYINTQWYKETGGYKDPMTWYNEKLEAAMKQVVLFKDQLEISWTLGIPMEKGKLYPVPDGYEIKIKNGEPCVDLDCHVPQDHIHQYAILVPKQVEYMEAPAEPIVAAIMLERKLKQPTSIDEAAETYAAKETQYSSMHYEHSCFKRGFIAGAKSDAAKEYWYQQFKQETKNG